MNGCFQANILAVTAVRPRYFNLACIWGPWPVVRVLSLSDADLSTRALTARRRLRAFGVCQDLTGGEALASSQSLYLAQAYRTLHLNAFRGVRAISKFD